MSEIENADGTVETPIDWEARAMKAEAKIVDMKTNQKKSEEKKETPKEVDTNFMTREDFEKEKFFDNNPDLVEHKENIDNLVSKWYSLKDAKIVILEEDKTIKARQTTKNSNFTNWEIAADWGQTYTQEEVANLPFNERKAIFAKFAQWKVVIK